MDVSELAPSNVLSLTLWARVASQGAKPNKTNICYGCVHAKYDTATKTQHFPFISVGTSVLQLQWS